MYKFSALLIFSVLINFCRSEQLPIVLWHGMGDSCCFPFSLGGFKKQLQTEVPESYIISLKFGKSLAEDVENGFFMHPNKQVEQACEVIQKDAKLQNGYHAIGFSQGSQFLRALKQRCPTPRMVNLISFGGQHQGVFGLPNCPSLSSAMCERFRELLNIGAYFSWVQRGLVQATYWHDPLHENDYRTFSTFLADINNERVINETYKQNLQDLKRFIMVKFMNDTVVQPKETQWFGFYEPGQDKKTLTLEESKLFKDDRLGLKQMKNDGKLVFIQTEGNHLKFTKQWFVANILPYLKEPKD